MNRNDTARQRRSRAPQPKRLSRLYPPSDMAPEAWQVALRRQYGREQQFKLENLGAEPVFSEFRVTNPITGGRYRVAIRGAGLRDNYCSCPDYATNELGTCKHVEFALAAVDRKRSGRAALKRGYQPPFSEIYLRYGTQRSVHFRPGIGCPLPLLAAAQKLFDEAAGWRLAPERFSRLDGFLARTIDEHELRVYDDALEFIAHARDAERRKELIDRVFLNGARSRSLQQLVKLRLHPYQVEGALFAARAGRCLIADEMGLGKTVQALAAAEIRSVEDRRIRHRCA
ncbi:MAG TPA: hypothetical protein VMH26_00710 [Burkholderiales bacterium]|nr:hypothetical protein [Burkholderiales bacterium]